MKAYFTPRQPPHPSELKRIAEENSQNLEKLIARQRFIKQHPDVFPSELFNEGMKVGVAKESVREISALPNKDNKAL